MRTSTQNIACSQRQMYTSVSYTPIQHHSIQHQYWKKEEEEKKKERKAVNAYLIKNSKGEGRWGGGGGTLTSSRKDWAEF